MLESAATEEGVTDRKSLVSQNSLFESIATGLMTIVQETR